jgi:hypothetical protein
VKHRFVGSFRGIGTDELQSNDDRDIDIDDRTEKRQNDERANAVTGTTLGVDNLVWVVSFAFIITLSPFIILLSFIFRIATVAQRTLAMGPFILRETEEVAAEYEKQDIQ